MLPVGTPETSRRTAEPASGGADFGWNASGHAAARERARHLCSCPNGTRKTHPRQLPQPGYYLPRDAVRRLPAAPSNSSPADSMAQLAGSGIANTAACACRSRVTARSLALLFS